ncbi:PPR repeat [Musa troglodytarum]|uniref:PPR repeat n=1 Tax=Musa troglodytarum TaxID=320322 RepID=A0A9E7EHT9_9LILI|nr:PPR repeat [Musa troglodytarum]
MTAKSPIFVIRRHLPIWVSLNYRSYTIASAAHVQGPPKDDKDVPDSAEFVSAVQVLKNRLHPDRLVHVLDSTSDVTLALKVFKWASKHKRFQQTAETYAHMIFKLGMVGDHEEMEVLLNEMFTEAMSFLDEGQVLEIEPYNTLLKGFCDVSRYQEATVYLKKMAEGESCSQLIEGLCVVKKIQESAEGYEIMPLMKKHKAYEEGWNSTSPEICDIGTETAEWVFLYDDNAGKIQYAA